jgi:hypothetical protein
VDIKLQDAQSRSTGAANNARTNSTAKKPVVFAVTAVQYL